jgi:hypothetical protein
VRRPISSPGSRLLAGCVVFFVHEAEVHRPASLKPELGSPNSVLIEGPSLGYRNEGCNHKLILPKLAEKKQQKHEETLHATRAGRLPKWVTGAQRRVLRTATGHGGGSDVAQDTSLAMLALYPLLVCAVQSLPGGVGD